MEFDKCKHCGNMIWLTGGCKRKIGGFACKFETRYEASKKDKNKRLKK